jgi:hypothetical protein
MSALPPKADMAHHDPDVRFVPNSDMAQLFDPSSVAAKIDSEMVSPIA